MTTTIEDELRELFAMPSDYVPIDARGLVDRGRRERGARRRHRVAAAATIALAAAVFVVHPWSTPARGDALTLAPASSPAVIATSRTRVRFSDGLEVWRSGSELFIGHRDVARGGYASLDVHHAHGAGGRDGLAIFVDDGIVTSIVHAVPRAVTVTLSGDRRNAEIACFDQTPGWCVWAASFGRPLTGAETRSLSSDPPAHIAVTD
ncbi:MAG TPA: hypothetical protein VH914_05345 [Acidimicrobiia bacterium]|nr:hypothetical protein [Acidimicrobiia bacterium]